LPLPGSTRNCEIAVRRVEQSLRDPDWPIVEGSVPTNLTCGILILFFALLSGCTSVSSSRPTVQPAPSPPPTVVTADQVVQAMAQDSFFSAYGSSNLAITGTVVAMDHRDSGLVLTLGTSGKGLVECDLSEGIANVRVGDRVRLGVSDPRQDVSRSGATVVIQECRLTGALGG